jgi:hypothetical protein
MSAWSISAKQSAQNLPGQRYTERVSTHVLFLPQLSHSMARRT